MCRKMFSSSLCNSPCFTISEFKTFWVKYHAWGKTCIANVLDGNLKNSSFNWKVAGIESLLLSTDLLVPAESGPFTSFHSVAFACTWAAFLRMSRTHLTHLVTIHPGKNVPTPFLSQLHFRWMPHCPSINRNCGDCCPDKPHECTSPAIFLIQDPHRKVANSKRWVICNKILNFPGFWLTTTISSWSPFNSFFKFCGDQLQMVIPGNQKQEKVDKSLITHWSPFQVGQPIR